MPSITLLTKAYSNSQLKKVGESLHSALEGLEADVQLCGTTPRGWIQVSVSGKDENVAVNCLAEKIGVCQVDLDSVTRFLRAKGTVVNLKISRNELHVDVGISHPAIIDATVSLQSLQAQMADGKKITLANLTELYGFCENLPLTIMITSVDREKNRLDAELSEKQQKQFNDWKTSLLDRLLIVGASVDEITRALERAQSGRDVVDVEPLGMFEHAVVCKLGTDAAGLIPKIGRSLGRAAFSVFCPRRILRALEKA